MSGSTIAERSRTLEIFLDAVAAHASDNASSLDERFKGLLDVDEELVLAARDLYNMAAGAGPDWQGLADALLAFGAASGDYDEDLEEAAGVPYYLAGGPSTEDVASRGKAAPTVVSVRDSLSGDLTQVHVAKGVTLKDVKTAAPAGRDLEVLVAHEALGLTANRAGSSPSGSRWASTVRHRPQAP